MRRPAISVLRAWLDQARAKAQTRLSLAHSDRDLAIHQALTAAIRALDGDGGQALTKLEKP